MENSVQAMESWLYEELVNRKLRVARGALQPIRMLDPSRYGEIEGGDEDRCKSHLITGILTSQRSLAADAPPDTVVFNDVISGLLIAGVVIRFDSEITDRAREIIRDSCPYCE